MTPLNLPILEEDDERCALLGIAARDVRSRAPRIIKPIIIEARDREVLIQRSKLSNAGSGDAEEIHSAIEQLFAAADGLIDFSNQLEAANRQNPAQWRNRRQNRQDLGDQLRQFADALKAAHMPPAHPHRSASAPILSATDGMVQERQLGREADEDMPKVHAPFDDYASFIKALRKGERLDDVTAEIINRPYMADLIIDPLLRRVAYAPDGAFDQVLATAIDYFPEALTADNVAGFALLSEIHTVKNHARYEAGRGFVQVMLAARPDLKLSAQEKISRGQHVLLDIFLTEKNPGVKSTKSQVGKAMGLNGKHRCQNRAGGRQNRAIWPPAINRLRIRGIPRPVHSHPAIAGKERRREYPPGKRRG